jgi:transcriptional regulator GlxA family with amidase domain
MSQGVDMEFLYLSSTLTPARCTPDVHITPTHTYDTCPRDIDVLLVGGPILTHRPEGAAKLFRDLFQDGKGKDGVVLLTTCTGSLWVADSGVLEGKKCTTNRMALALAKERNPSVKWEDRRWVVDKLGKGEVWTSGGAGCGKYLRF